MVTPRNKIEYHRKVNFLSQKDVAERCGISQQYYGRLEKNPDKIDIGIAKKLKTILKLKSLDELVEDVV